MHICVDWRVIQIRTVQQLFLFVNSAETCTGFTVSVCVVKHTELSSELEDSGGLQQTRWGPAVGSGTVQEQTRHKSGRGTRACFCTSLLGILRTVSLHPNCPDAKPTRTLRFSSAVLNDPPVLSQLTCPGFPCGTKCGEEMLLPQRGCCGSSSLAVCLRWRCTAQRAVLCRLQQGVFRSWISLRQHWCCDFFVDLLSDAVRIPDCSVQQVGLPLRKRATHNPQ